MPITDRPPPGAEDAVRSSESRLEREGHRLTTTRKAVVSAVAGAGRPLTVEEICDETPGVGRATVFRTVKLLQELDLLCRVPFEDGTPRYITSTGNHHHHLVCSECGSVTEFASAALDEEIRQQATRAGFALDAHTVELYGRCQQCGPPPA